MNATDYIAALQALVEMHGDLECVDAYDVPMDPPEFVEGVFVLAENASA